MQILDNLHYTENHEWILLDGDFATVGITDYAQGELGDIVYVDVDTLGEQLKVGDVFGSVEAVKTVSDLFMPLSGKIEVFNEKLEANPELLNNDPYQEGWIVKVKVDAEGVRGKLLSASEYKTLIGI